MRYNGDVKCLFLYNPHSGRGKIQKKLPHIEKKLKERYDEVVIHATTSGADMTAWAREGAEKYDAIIFSGGDGSFNNVLSGIGESKVQLGYIPAGTVNDAAHSLRIPVNIKRALKIVTEGYSEALDCMRINGKEYAIYIAAACSLAAVSFETSQKKKKRIGWLAYAFEVLKRLRRVDVFPIRVTCGGETLSTHGVLIFVMNGRWVARFPVNRSASMQDGEMEIAVIKQVERPNFFRRIGAVFSLTSLMIGGCRIRKRDIVFMKGDRITVETGENVVWDFDGEKGVCGSVEIELLRGRVNLFVPKNKKI